MVTSAVATVLRDSFISCKAYLISHTLSNQNGSYSRLSLFTRKHAFDLQFTFDRGVIWALLMHS